MAIFLKLTKFGWNRARRLGDASKDCCCKSNLAATSIPCFLQHLTIRLWRDIENFSKDINTNKTVNTLKSLFKIFIHVIHVMSF